MTKTSLGMTLLLCAACFASGCQEQGRGLAERVTTASQALSIDTLANAITAVGRLSNDHEPALGQVITAPTQPILKSFTFIVNAPVTSVFRAEVYAWSGTQAAGANLFESAPVTGSGANQNFTFDTGNLSLTTGAQYILFLTTLKDAGTGDGFVSALPKSADSYTGGDMFVLESPSASVATWTTSAWASTTSHLVFRAYFDLVPSSNLVASSLATPSVFGQPVNWLATLATSGSPTGNVTFTDGVTALGSAPLSAQTGFAQASFQALALAVGTHAVTAQYGGDVNFSPRSASFSQVVQQASTLTALGSGSSPSNVGAAVTLKATVSPLSPGAGLATGSVTFTEAGGTLGTSNLDGSGIATLTVSSLGLGQHVIDATYGGDTNFETSTSADFEQTVNADGTTLALGSSASPAAFHSNITFTAIVSQGAASGVPTGTVIFEEGANTLGSGDLDGTGAAIFSTTALSGGNHTITALYGGDPSHAPASGSFMQVVTPAATLTTLASSANPALPGQVIVFSAAVAATGAAATGSVTFADGALTLGTSLLADNGTAMLTSPALTPGAHAVTAAYSGDGNFRASVSSSLLQQVTRDPFAPSDAGAGGETGESSDAGADSGGSAGASGDTSADAGTASHGDAGPGGSTDISRAGADSGCGCRAAPRSPASGAGLLWLFAALVVSERRSRRKRALSS